MSHWIFAHNGTIPRFDQIAPRLETSEEVASLLPHRRGTTDSELAFLWILEPLTGESWKVVPDQHLLAVNAGVEQVELTHL